MADFRMIGGDARQRMLARLLRDEGHRVRTWGFASEPQEMVGAEAAVLFPVPSFRGNPPAVPGEFGTILWAEQAFAYCQGVPVAGYFTSLQHARVEASGASFVLNLAQDEEFLVENAVLTAEGAICEASGQSGRSLMGSRCLITGFGRIGEALCRRLLALDALVTVAARDSRQRDKAEAMGARALDFPQLAGEADIIFNTVPARIVEMQTWKLFGQDTLYVELASAPGGIDPAEALEAGFRMLDLPGLPGKKYPRSSAQCILRALKRGFPPGLVGVFTPDMIQ